MARRMTLGTEGTLRVSDYKFLDRVTDSLYYHAGRIDLQYFQTERGSKLLTSGWWGRSRHPNYLYVYLILMFSGACSLNSIFTVVISSWPSPGPFQRASQRQSPTSTSLISPSFSSTDKSGTTRPARRSTGRIGRSIRAWCHIVLSHTCIERRCWRQSRRGVG